MPPRHVGPYELLSVIGRGGVGTVYRGRHQISRQLAAVKVLGPAPAVDAVAARRLAREYEVLRALDHPNVVRAFDAGVHEGYSFLAMELVIGLDLRRYLSPVIDEGTIGDPTLEALLEADASSSSERAVTEPGPEAIRALAAMMDEPETEPVGYPCAPAAFDDAPRAPPRPMPSPEVREALNRPARIARVRAALAQVCAALAYVHANGLVHRDIKPTNIMVDDRRVARLMDFGLVRVASDDDTLAQTGRVVGTYRYMSPEQAQGLPVDGRSDLYSLGVILYELLAGMPPFASTEPVGLWREILTARPPAVSVTNPGVEPDLAHLAESLLEKDPARRPASAAEVMEALGAGGGLGSGISPA